MHVEFVIEFTQSCSILFSVLPNYPYEQIQNLTFLLQIVFELKLFPWHMVGPVCEEKLRRV